MSSESSRPPLSMTIGAALVSAALFYFGTGLHPVPVLSWLAPVPLLLLARRLSVRTAAVLSFLVCLAGTANSWAFYAQSHDVPLWPVGVFISVGFSGTFLAAFLTYRALVRQDRPLSAAAGLAAVWTGLLYLSSVLNPMGIMGTLSTDQADLPIVLQPAAYLGSWGVEFLVWFVPAAIVAAVTTRPARAVRLRSALVGVVVLAAALGLGWWRLASAPQPSDPQRVALIIDNESGWGAPIPGDGDAVLSGYLDLESALPAEVTTVVLPEGAFRVSDETGLTALTTTLAEAASRHGRTIVAGYVRFADGAKYNEALVASPSGETDRYLKQHDTVSPTGDTLVFAPDDPAVGVAICADLNHPDPAREYAAAGATALLVPADDNVDNGRQHARAAAVHGVENGVTIAWSARRGTAMVSDGYGRVLAETDTGGYGHLVEGQRYTTVVADFPAGPGGTFHTATGDWFAWATVAGALLLIVLAVRRRIAPATDPEN